MVKNLAKKIAKRWLSASTVVGWNRITEPFTGAWQQNVEWQRKDVLCYHAIFACITLIAGDIAKCAVRRVRRDAEGIWTEVDLGRNSVLIQPNAYQTRIQFFESWVLSKLIRGNSYILKEKNNRGDIVRMHVLHPDLVLPLVSDDGQVFYQIGQDNLAGISQTGVTVPASEIIHDRFNCFYHPLVGLSPIFASGLPAYMGMKILENSAHLFKNGSRPSGILTVPEAIRKETAQELSEMWEASYGGENFGKVAILGGDLKYQALAMKAEEAQLVEQLKLTAEMVCSTFHVPAYKVIGNAPAYNNIEALEQSYYSQCLQVLIESIEACLDHGFDMPSDDGFEFDLDNLLRMDTKSQVETLGIGTTKGLVAPNEGRRKLNLPPVPGGEMPYLQEQNWPISELSKRTMPPLEGPPPPPPPPAPEGAASDVERAAALAEAFRKELLNAN